MPSIHHHGPCHPFVSSSNHVIHLPYQPVTMSFIHNIINSPCHTVTLSSYHPAINSHWPCHPFIMSSSQDHGPCHPFTVSASRHVTQALSHHITPRWRDQKEVLVLLETTLARVASTLGQILLFLFCLFYIPLLLALLPTLPHSTAYNHLHYSWSSFDLFIIKTSKLF